MPAVGVEPTSESEKHTILSQIWQLWLTSWLTHKFCVGCALGALGVRWRVVGEYCASFVSTCRFFYSFFSHLKIVLVEFDADEIAVGVGACHACRATAHAVIQNRVAFVRICQK